MRTRLQAQRERQIEEGTDTGQTEEHISSAPLSHTENSQSYTTYLASSVAAHQITSDEKIESFEREHNVCEEKKAFIPVPRNSVPQEANIIGSHVVYRRKPNCNCKGAHRALGAPRR